ncbi:DUF5050 domain-containing protein [Candidatus Contubernalis alkaliaceticus]|uniref:DUF5050 domain-containing protein n=1 Tax=Candidatus Contubernalis alkaliaceticus TaxID=338645 RepID=UPI001F4C3136|nr:DUF5050 domain-containing protein [Candidatus Contubernalis alkalaceticus]UNC91095.1 DUF5050 domain-containing protein [Candidatus Contubernalis alkalaceticus]
MENATIKRFKIRTDGSNRTQLNNDSSRGLNVTGEWVYYINKDDGDKIYKIKTDGSSRNAFNFDKTSDLNVVDGWVYFINDSDEKRIYKIKEDGSDRTCLTEEPAMIIIVVEDWIYYWSNDTSYLNKVSTDGSNFASLYDEFDIPLRISIVGEWIYYHSPIGSWPYNYKIKIDGTQRQLVY